MRSRVAILTRSQFVIMQIYANRRKNKHRERFTMSLIDELLQAYLSVLGIYLEYIRVISALNQLYL